MQNNTTIIIIGATGDLATKNLIPALYELFISKPDSNFSLIGVAKNSFTPEELLKNVRPFLTQFDEKKWNLFLQKSNFIAADITEPASYATLEARILKVEHGTPSNRIIYCACRHNFLLPLQAAV